MKTFNNFFHECLQEYYSGGLCLLCGQDRWTELAHNESNSKANHKILGDLIDAPIIGTLPSCHECNMAYKRKLLIYEVCSASLAAMSMYKVMTAAREAFTQYLNYKLTHKEY